MKSTSHAVMIDGRPLTLSNLDKVLYPAAGFAKRDVIDYYVRISPVLLPHLRDRPLTLKRYPNGVDRSHFYEKTCPAHRPAWVDVGNVASRHRGEDIGYCLVNDLPTLVWVANLASLELHTLLSRMSEIGRPTFMVFDLDPGPGTELRDCLRLALQFRRLLSDLGLDVLAKTSGGKGLHLCIPLNTAVTFEQTKSFSRALARHVESLDPRCITSNMRRDRRTRRVFIDWSQNDAHKTTACVYTLRGQPRPTVSTPLTWDEIEAASRRKATPTLAFEPAVALRRVEAKGDLFAGLLEMKQKLPELAHVG